MRLVITLIMLLAHVCLAGPKFRKLSFWRSHKAGVLKEASILDVPKGTAEELVIGSVMKEGTREKVVDWRFEKDESNREGKFGGPSLPDSERWYVFFFRAKKDDVGVQFIVDSPFRWDMNKITVWIDGKRVHEMQNAKFSKVFTFDKKEPHVVIIRQTHRISDHWVSIALIGTDLEVAR